MSQHQDMGLSRFLILRFTSSFNPAESSHMRNGQARAKYTPFSKDHPSILPLW